MGPKALHAMSIGGVALMGAVLGSGLLLVTGLVVLHPSVAGGIPSGTSGPAGANGSAGAGTSWGTLTLTFQLGGKAAGLSVTQSTCSPEGHGAYACDLTVLSVGNASQKLVGLSYAPNPAFYYAGANPTLGQIYFNGNNSSTTFTLWFQAVHLTGAAQATILLLVNPVAKTV